MDKNMIWSTSLLMGRGMSVNESKKMINKQSMTNITYVT